MLKKYYFFLGGFEEPCTDLCFYILSKLMFQFFYIFVLLIFLLFIIDFLFNEYSSDENIYPIYIKNEYTSMLDILFVIFVTLYIFSMMISSIGFIFNISDILNGGLDFFTMNVNIVASQWYWNVQSNVQIFDCYSFNIVNVLFDNVEIYSSDVMNRWYSDEVFFLPSSVVINLVGTSSDVIHSFGLPSGGIKFDCLPGRKQYYTTLFIKEGSYDAHCYELCGANHAYMQLSLEVLHFKDYYTYLLN